MPHILGHFEPGNISPSTMYRIYGTNEPYRGMVVEVGGYLYTTVGGALESNSYQLVAAQQMTPDDFGDAPPPRLQMTPDDFGDAPRPNPEPGGLQRPNIDFGITPNPNLVSPLIERPVPIGPGGMESLPGERPRPRPTPTPGTLPDSGLESGDIITQFRVGDNSQFGGRRSYYYGNGNRVPNGTALHHHTIPPRGRSNFMTQHTMDGREQDVFTSPPRPRSGGNVGRGVGAGNNQSRDILPGGGNTNMGGGGSY